MKRHSLLSLTLTFLLFSLITSKSNLMLYMSKEAVKLDIQNQLNEISKSWNLVGSKYPDYEQNDVGYVTDKYKFTDIEISSAEFYQDKIENIEISSASAKPSIVIEGSKAFQAIVTFTYEYSRSTGFYADEGKGQIAIYSNNFLFSKLSILTCIGVSFPGAFTSISILSIAV